LPAGAPLLVAPYNLEPRKNLDALLAAVARLKEQTPGLMLALYGRAAVDDEREARFRARVSELRLDGAVSLTGFLEDPELAGLMERAEVFVFPSLYEGFGLPVLEAMTRGACVVARGESAMAEVVGDAGVLVETADPEQLAGALGALLRDPARRGRLGARARARAADWTTERMARETLACYERALRGPG
jgi:glycosyltransferase involved in cell wall biosynthesis